MDLSFFFQKIKKVWRPYVRLYLYFKLVHAGTWLPSNWFIHWDQDLLTYNLISKWSYPTLIIEWNKALCSLWWIKWTSFIGFFHNQKKYEGRLNSWLFLESFVFFDGIDTLSEPLYVILLWPDKIGKLFSILLIFLKWVYAQSFRYQVLQKAVLSFVHALAQEIKFLCNQALQFHG